MKEAAALALIGPPFLAALWALSCVVGGEWVALLCGVPFLLLGADIWRRISRAASAAKVVS